jgi:TPR repeat protein
LLATAVAGAHAQPAAEPGQALHDGIAMVEAGNVAGAEQRLRPLAAGDPEAAAWLAAALLKRGDRPGLAEAIQLLHHAAGAGNARAKYLLAFQHAIGQGVPRDEPRAAQLFREAAEGGIARAAYNLGVLYARGAGVPADAAQAAAWYERAARGGDPYGAYAFARTIELSPQARERAAEMAQYYRAAAEQGHLPAAVRYGGLLGEGRGVPRDPVAAERFLRHALNNGYPEAAMVLGDLSAQVAMSGRNDAARAATASAIRWYTQAADAGIAVAQFKLANALFSGAGMERDLVRAEQWYERAARQGLADAQYVLGVWKTGGIAGNRDPAEGYMWLLLAERQGNGNARKVRTRVLEKTPAEDVRKGEAAAAAFRPKQERPAGRPLDETPPLRPMPPPP